jgi:hypothetical protein
MPDGVYTDAEIQEAIEMFAKQLAAVADEGLMNWVEGNALTRPQQLALAIIGPIDMGGGCELIFPSGIKTPASMSESNLTKGN